jgi:S-methylmethionine-dependent homocysteine/selenocysteine methylase
LRNNERKPIDYFIDIYPSWIKLGCKFIGGCCGFVAEDIKKLKESLN